ncbi:MAG: hypothetical protein AAF432_15355 [Planctomycetota bacterium]
MKQVTTRLKAVIATTSREITWTVALVVGCGTVAGCQSVVDDAREGLAGLSDYSNVGEAPIRPTAYEQSLNEARWKARAEYQAQERQRVTENPHLTIAPTTR